MRKLAPVGVFLVLPCVVLVVACEQPTEVLTPIGAPPPFAASFASEPTETQCIASSPTQIFPETCRTVIEAAPSTEGNIYIGSEGSTPYTRDQREPVLVTLSEPVYRLTVDGNGPVKCTGDYGEVIALDSAGTEQRVPFELVDPSDCGLDDIAGHILASLPPEFGVKSFTITPMSPLEWLFFIFHDQVANFDCCLAHPSVGYTLFFDEALLQVQIRPVGGSMEVRPAQTPGSTPLTLEIGVYNRQGTPVRDRTVTLSLTPTEGTAGHSHEGNKPAGALSLITVETGSFGVATVRYTAPEPSGSVAILGQSAGARDTLDTIHVKIPGLEPLPDGGTYELVGLTGGHPGARHNGTPAVVTLLQALADSLASFADRIPTLPDSMRPTGRFPRILGVNDMSLPEGGVFDLDMNWVKPHTEHRLGTNADIDVRRGSQDDDYADYVSLIWHTKFGRMIGDERASRNHFHLK